jgi:hypothetical protein
MKPVLAGLFAIWTTLLHHYYDPARGMNYAALKAHDAVTLENLRQSLGKVDANALDPKERLAYWINVYNINTVATIVEAYPVKSIKDLSTDPLIFTVFKKKRVPYRGELLSLDDVENDKIRGAFHDPRIHFAINCAAKSCPPLRMEAYTGETLDAQLDEQTRNFLVSHTLIGGTSVYITKIMDWFGDDFGNKAAFLHQYGITLPASDLSFKYLDYDWSLNDAHVSSRTSGAR